MTGLFLAVLAVVWIAVLLPAALRARRNDPLTATERWKRRMNLIAPKASNGRWIVVPESSDRLARAAFRRGQRRRKRILVFLAAAAAVSGLGAVLLDAALWQVHVAFDASLAIYVVLLIEGKRRRVERLEKVRSLSQRRASKPGSAADWTVRARDELHFYEPTVRAGGS